MSKAFRTRIQRTLHLHPMSKTEKSENRQSLERLVKMETPYGRRTEGRIVPFTDRDIIRFYEKNPEYLARSKDIRFEAQEPVKMIVYGKTRAEYLPAWKRRDSLAGASRMPIGRYKHLSEIHYASAHAVKGHTPEETIKHELGHHVQSRSGRLSALYYKASMATGMRAQDWSEREMEKEAIAAQRSVTARQVVKRPIIKRRLKKLAYSRYREMFR